MNVKDKEPEGGERTAGSPLVYFEFSGTKDAYLLTALIANDNWRKHQFPLMKTRNPFALREEEINSMSFKVRLTLNLNLGSILY